MSASTVLSVIAPIAGAAPSPSATADKDVSLEFAAMVSETAEADAAPPSSANLGSGPTGTPSARAMQQKPEAPKALSPVAVIDPAADAMVETSPVSADAAPEATDIPSDTPIPTEAPEADGTPKVETEPSDVGAAPLLAAPTPRPTQVAAAAPAATSVSNAANGSAPVSPAPLDQPPVADGVPEAAAVQTQARATVPPAVSPAPVSLAEPARPEPVRLAAAARDKAAGIDVDASASSSEPPKATASSASVPPSPPSAPSAASQAVAAPPAFEPGVPPQPDASSAAVEEASPVPNKAETPTPAHTQVITSSLSRATVETTIQIAARIVRQLEGRQTRFDMVLTPEDLGRVEVSLDIDADGQLAARLAFDNPAAAADLRGRADDLRRQLTEAGFQLSQDAFEFTERGAGAFSGGAFERRGQDRAFSFAGGKRLGEQADLAAAAPAAWINLSLTPDRVDMRV